MVRDRLEHILAAARLELPADSDIEISGADPVLGTRFAAGEAVAVALGLSGAAAARIFALRSGPNQKVRVDVRDAATTLLGFVFQWSESGSDLKRHANPVSALYRAGDGRWIHLHGGFPRLAQGALDLLQCDMDPASIAGRVAKWSAEDLEEALAERGLCGGAVRSEDEWADHPQGRALAPLPAVEIERIGDGEPMPLSSGVERPLSGVRVLDLTRVLAGPACGRALASHGADVLRIGAERLPSIEPFVVDTGRGKRNAFLDLDRVDDAERLRRLLGEADVFCQGYRPGSLERRGFGPAELAAHRPGIVVVSVDCYGHVGPWSARPGWEQLAQSVVGIARAEGGPAVPRLIPAAATDYTTGALAAYGAMEALARRAVEGGSWHVRVSLCQTGMWLTRLGADRDPSEAGGLGDVRSRCEERDSAWGRLTHLAPVVRMDRTPPRWDRPPSPLGTHAPEWARG